MIQKFRWKFIGASVAALLIVLLITLGSLVGITRIQNQNEVNRVLTALVKNEGHLSPHNAQPAFGNQDDLINRNFLAGKYNPEAVYQYRYFAVTVDANHQVKVINNNNVYKIKNTEIADITRRTLAEHNKQGNIKAGQNQYAYRVTKDSAGQTLIVFLNETLIYNRFWLMFRVAVVLGIGALIVFALVLILVSRRAIKPIIDTYHKQQEFITNAGHELKTPLAVISANTEMEEMLGNDSEWNQSTKEQVDKLTKLVNRLISLARAGEMGELTLSKVNFSKIVEQSTQDFKYYSDIQNADWILGPLLYCCTLPSLELPFVSRIITLFTKWLFFNPPGKTEEEKNKYVMIGIIFVYHLIKYVLSL